MNRSGTRVELCPTDRATRSRDVLSPQGSVDNEIRDVEKTHEKFDKVKIIIKERVKDSSPQQLGPVATTRRVAQSSRSLDPVIIKSKVIPEALGVKDTMKTKVVAPTRSTPYGSGEGD